MQKPVMQITGATLGTASPREPAEFYRRLLGWESEIETNWAQVRLPDDHGGQRTLNIEIEPDYVPPTWPSVRGQQQIMTHLDIAVEELAAAVAWALTAGAREAGFQPQQTVRVMLVFTTS